MTVPTDAWAIGDHYERYVGRWSRPVAAKFLDWLGVPAGASWLDVGCGTGALADTILRRADPRQVAGVDPSLAFVQQAQRRLGGPMVRFLVGRAELLPNAARTFDAAVAGLALNFVPAPEQAVAEMARVTRPKGAIAAYVWDYAGAMQLMRYFWDAAIALDPNAASLDEGTRFPICRRDRLEALFRSAGLDAVATTAIDVPTRFVSFDDYWTPFLGGQGPAPGYAMGLPPDRRDRLREAIRAALPIQADGSIGLTARALAVRGRVRA